MEINLGLGDVEICPVEKEGRHGVLLKKHKEKHAIGEPTELEGPLDDFDTETDVIIWLNHMDSARVFQDEVNLALLNMQGFTCERKLSITAKRLAVVNHCLSSCYVSRVYYER